MQAQCAVTFEFQMRPPVTWKGTVDGFSAATIMRRATDTAQKALSPRNWSSAVCVILEREGVAPEVADDES